MNPLPDLDPLAAARAVLDRDPARAAAMARQILTASPHAAAPRLLLAAALRRCGDVAAALAILAPLAITQPKAWGAQYEFGLALGTAGRLDEAAAVLARAVGLNPALPVRQALAAALHRLGRDEEALAALQDDTEDSSRPLRAAILLQLGDAAGAITELHRALAGAPDDPALWHAQGHALRANGRGLEAIACYRRALALRPAYGEAWWSLANLKTFRFEPDDVAAMEAALATATGKDDLAYISFALGKAREDAGEDASAFAAYAAGNAARRAVMPYDADAASAFVARTIAVFSPALLAARRGSGDPRADPIFIVGMPRSGSTLVEQILGSHSAVEGLSELPDFPALARALPGGYPELLAELPPDAFAALGRSYLERVAMRRRLGRPRFVDKLPGNFLHAGLIHLALPNAAIIDVRREPLSCCLSLFKQIFAAGQAYSYDLGDLGRAYADYVSLTRHFDRVLPGRILQLSYEALVDDPETQTRWLLERLGLDFEPGCLRFFESDRVVRTASSEQVRLPMNRDGLERWRRFEAWLGPLRVGLTFRADAG